MAGMELCNAITCVIKNGWQPTKHWYYVVLFVTTAGIHIVTRCDDIRIVHDVGERERIAWSFGPDLRAKRTYSYFNAVFSSLVDCPLDNKHWLLRHM